MKTGELSRSEIPNYSSRSGIDELRKTRSSLSNTKVQGTRDMAFQDINSRINSRANGGVTGSESYTYEQRKEAKRRLKDKAQRTTSTATPSKNPTASTSNSTTISNNSNKAVTSTTAKNTPLSSINKSLKNTKVPKKIGTGKAALIGGSILAAGGLLSYGINKISKKDDQIGVPGKI